MHNWHPCRRDLSLLFAAGFGSRSKERPPRPLPDKLKPLLEECRPLYELLRSRALRPLSALQLQEARDAEAGGLQQGETGWRATVRLLTAWKGSAAALLTCSLCLASIAASRGDAETKTCDETRRVDSRAHKPQLPLQHGTGQTPPPVPGAA